MSEHTSPPLTDSVASYSDLQLPYLMLQISVNCYQVGFDQLEAPTQMEIAQKAHKLNSLYETLLASPEAQTVSLPENEINAAFAEIIERYPDFNSFENDIRKHGMNVDLFKDSLAREMRVNAILDTLLARDSQVSEEEIETYYEQNKTAFFQPEMRKVRHLLITINDQLPDHSRSDSLTLACDILEKTGQNSHAFIQQIKLHSECPTTLHDGLVGTLPKGKLYPELDALLFTMQPGEISGPVETEMGWHLLWCEAIHPASYLCLETIRHEIRGHLKQLKQKRALQRWKTLLQPYQPVIKAIE